MLLSAQDYLRLKDEGKDPFEKASAAKTEKCAQCGVALQEAVTGYRKVGKESYCSDDYFDVLGQLVEAHPVGLPRKSVGR